MAKGAPSITEVLQQASSLYQKGELELAGNLYETALDLEPDCFEARNQLGTIKLHQGFVESAIVEFERALILSPQSAEALCNLGNALASQQRFDEALACYDGALAANPQHWGALNNRGNVLSALGRYDEAIVSYGNAIALGSSQAAPYFNRGLAHFALLHYAESIADFDAAIARSPDHAEAWQARGHSLRALRRYEDAAASYAQAVSRNPNLNYALGEAFNARVQLCDWADYDLALNRLVDGVNAGTAVAVPFILFSLSDDPVAQLSCAANYAHRNHSVPQLPTSNRGGRGRDKIRLAYLSAKFRDHAGAHLVVDLLERHDKRRFETIGISFGPDVKDGMRARFEACFDEFFDVRALSDADICELIRARQVDIAIDLMGYQENARPSILAYRAAPVQVSFLSWTGTMGATFMDYVIGDHVVIPSGDERYYSERVVRLPDSYQVNDSKKRISDRMPTRADVGLPQDGFVFCCFNNNFKITPAIFDVWMRLLKKVDRSVLWLLGATAIAERNLSREAELRGVNPERLVFAPKLPLADHLARHRLGNLFLDTVPCNAHVTASDALWTGLPVLTCMGRSFMSRVAGSLLNALHLPELVTTSLDEYEARALELATNPSLMQELTKKLVRNRSVTPLFDTDRFRRHIEAAYANMWSIHGRGEKPQSFAVQAID